MSIDFVYGQNVGRVITTYDVNGKSKSTPPIETNPYIQFHNVAKGHAVPPQTPVFVIGYWRELRSNDVKIKNKINGIDNGGSEVFVIVYPSDKGKVSTLNNSIAQQKFVISHYGGIKDENDAKRIAQLLNNNPNKTKIIDKLILNESGIDNSLQI